MFDECKSRIDQEDVPLTLAINFLRTRRLELEPLRVKILSLLDSLLENGMPHEAGKFMDSLRFYFRACDVEGSRMTHARDFLRQMNYWNELEPVAEPDEWDFVKKELHKIGPRACLSIGASVIIEALRSRWSMCCENYSKMKLEIIGV